MLEIALDCVRRGWYVFPCVPRDKRPLAGLAPRGFLDATLDEEQVRKWWTAKPDANVGIATGASGLCVVDIDHGIASYADACAFMPAYGLPWTFAVRTGRRPEYGIQLYYSGVGLKSTGWKLGDVSGDIRCSTGYVMAPGSIHPSGEPYIVAAPNDIAPVPAAVHLLTAKDNDADVAASVDDETATEWKTWLYEYADRNAVELRGFEKRVPNGWWLGITCPWTLEHTSGPGAESSTVLGILDGKIAFECSHGTCKAAKRDTAVFKDLMPISPSVLGGEPGEGPSITLGSGLPAQEKKEVDWHTLFHTQNDVLHCPPPTFFIEDFLAKQAICALAAPVAQRKSLIALNIVRSLVTGAPLFGFLPVRNLPERVLYLCPEMGLISMSERIKKIGLTKYVGDCLFIRSMNLGNLDLMDIPDEALEGSVLIVDTAIRFMKGDENSSADMQVFSETLFQVQRRQGPNGAIVILYHSPKATKDASELTLENCMRGSGELGAAITDAHGTRLQVPDDPYNSPSFIRHIKQRDYKGQDDFEVSGDESGLLTRVGEGKAVLKVNMGGAKANKDGKEEAARAIIAANLDKSARQLEDLLAEHGIKRSRTWANEVRSKLKSELTGSGSQLSE